MKKSLFFLPLLVALLLLISACDSSNPGSGTNPSSPSDTTRTHNPSRQPGDSVEPDPDWGDYFASHWDSTGLTPEDIEDDYRDVLDYYDPYEYARSWVYQRTVEGEDQTVDFLYVRVDEETDFDPFLLYRVREDPQLALVRQAQVIRNNYHLHGQFSAYDNFDHPYGSPSIIDWTFYCFCAADAGDTIRYRQHVVEGDTVRRELVKVIGWDETVDLPDTSYSACYAVTIDSMIADGAHGYHRTITEYYAPEIGLVKRVELLDSAGVQLTTTLEYKPPATWPWYYQPPTEPGDPGEEIQLFFPMVTGRSWDYHFTGDWQPDQYQRTVCSSAAPGQTGHLHYLMNNYSTTWDDTTGLMEHPNGGLWYTYNGNQLLRTNAINQNYQALKQFYRFPNVEPGQVLYDSSYSNSYSSYGERARVIALGQTVTVEAGTFEDVFVVSYYKGSGSSMNWSSFSNTEYYAPGVGLILVEGYHADGMETWETRKELIAWNDTTPSSSP